MLNSSPPPARVNHKELNWALLFCLVALIVFVGSENDSGWMAVFSVTVICLNLLSAAFHILVAFLPILFPAESFTPDE
jgi:hypothetical protein